MKATDHLPSFRKKKKRKQMLRALACFSPVVALFCLVTAVYISSYEEQAEGPQGTPGTVIQAGQREESLPSEAVQNHGDTFLEENSLAMAADDSTDIYITPRMTYTLEVYDARTDQLTTETQPIPNAMYGLNRVELEQYLVDLAAVENEGLTDIRHHYQLREFSRRAFTVRRTITEKEPEYAVFLIAEDGYLVAYTGDRTQVYEHTQIPLEDFPLEQQAMLTQGVYMKTWADYYDFLETYSS